MKSNTNQKENSIALMSGESTDTIPFMPITMIYAAKLLGVPYKRYATEAAVQAEAQLRFAERFGAAHVSVISDPACEAADLGSWAGFPEDDVPYVDEAKSLLADKTHLATLKPVRPESGKRMSNRLNAVRKLSESAGDTHLVEGWVEGPCAEAADIRGLNRLMMDFYDDEAFINDLLDFIVDLEIPFALAQLDAGAHIIGIGDAASSLIGPELYERHIAARTKKYIDAIHEAGGLVRLHICGRTEGLAKSWIDLNADMIDIDYGNSMAEVRRVLGPDGAALAGNLDPVREVRDGTPESIHRLLTERQSEVGKKFIVGAGCEIPKGTPEESLFAMREFAEQR